MLALRQRKLVVRRTVCVVCMLVFAYLLEAEVEMEFRFCSMLEALLAIMLLKGCNPIAPLDLRVQWGLFLST